MLGKIVLWISALAFIPYGLVCLFSPETPVNFAGLQIVSGDGYAEIGAMYGGLQTGFGIFCLLGALRQDLYRPVLLSLVVVIGGLALGRIYSTLTGDEAVGGYTWGATIYEAVTAILAAVAYRKG